MEISLHYVTIDGVNRTRQFRTLRGAQRYAQKWMGETPEIGSFYAVSFDGIATLTAYGISLRELFPKTVE
jgi:hypothetical protein